MRTHALLPTFAVALLACSSSSSSSSNPLPFTPSNVDLGSFDLKNAGDVVISGANCGIMDTESLRWSCVDPSKYVAKTITLADQSRLSVFVVRSLRVEASALVDVSGGHLPVAIVALDSMTLLGSVRVRPGYGGGFYNAKPDLAGAGPGGGAGGLGTTKQGGAGGAYCGSGGAGGVEDKSAASPNARSTAYGSPTLVPLVGGSAGGRSSITDGAGGGAIELVAGNGFTLGAGAFVSVPGGAGFQGGLAADQEATGGGSGGAILIEATTVTIDGVLAANGGGGGSGAGGSGGGGGKASEPGHDQDAKPAAGGFGGGAGGAGDAADATDAQSGSTFSAPGGGGGAGRIRVNSASGARKGAGTITPSEKSTCFTQGKVAS